MSTIYFAKKISTEFVPNKLNVAGENHGEASRKFDLEFLSRYDLNSENYWEEQELSVSEENLKEKKGMVPKADPALLKLVHFVLLIKEMMTDLENHFSSLLGLKKIMNTSPDKWRLIEIDQIQLPELKEKVKTETDMMEIFLPGVIVGMLNNYTSIEGRAREVDLLSSVQIKKSYEILNIINENNEKIKQSLEIIKTETNDDEHKPWDLTKFKDSIITLKNIIDSILDSAYEMSKNVLTTNLQIEPLETGLESRVSASRSYYMNQTANELSDKPGLWKVGSSHVDDIIKNIPLLGEPEYNLIPKKAFDEILFKHGLSVVNEPARALVTDNEREDK